MFEKETNDNIDINSYFEVMEKEYNSITNACDLYTRLRSELFISDKNRKDEIIGFIRNNPSGRVLITGSAGIGKSFLLDKVVKGLNELEIDTSSVYGAFNYSETIRTDFANKKLVIIDGLDFFKNEVRAEIERLILLGGPCVVTLRTPSIYTYILGYYSFMDTFDLVINLDDDLNLSNFTINGIGGVGKAPMLVEYLTSIGKDRLDTADIELLEGTIQQYDQSEKISIIEPGIELPKKEIVVPSKEIISGISVLKDTLIEAVYKNPDLVYHMSSRQFEEFVAEIYERLGYKVELTKMTRDGGKDIILYTNGPTGHNMYYVECKRYKKEKLVDIGLVRSFYGVVEANRATAGILVTSSSFTKGAREFEKQVFRRMTLLDYMELLNAVIKKV